MTDIALDQTTGDLLLIDGAAAIVDGLDGVVQRVYIKLRTFRGEWFLDLEAGLPYHDRVLIRGANEADLLSIFTQGILVVDGIESVDNLEMTFGDSDDRALRIEGEATSIVGTVPISVEVPGVT